MAPRSFWKGYLKLSLVTCPVTLEPARTARETMRFHTLNRKTGNRVESVYVDAKSGKPVADKDQVKGYGLSKDRYVLLEEELDAVALESTRTIDIERFVDRDQVDWTWLDRPHLVKPSDKVGEEAFAVIRAAMEATATAAISRLVLYRREHPVMVEPCGKGIVLWTLRYGHEVRPAEDYFPEKGKADPKLTRLVTELIEARTEEWDPKFLKDSYQANLKKIVAGKSPKKAAARKTEPDRPEPTADNVVSIMDALKRSVAAEKKRR